MQKKTLPIALCAIALAIAQPTSALEHSHDGSGDAVLLPYYDLNGRSTILVVSNHSDVPKAVRVVVAEGRNGRPVLAFNVYLAARDSWSAAMDADQGSPPSGPWLVTSDESCTSEEFGPQGEPFSNSAYSGVRNDGLGQEAGRSYTGQVEIIELGTLVGAPAQLIAEGACDALRARFDSDGPWAVNSNADVDPPSGRISAELQIVEVAGGVAFDVDSFAMTGFSAVARHGRGDNDTDDVRIYKPVAPVGASEFVVDGVGRVPSSRPADAVSLLLMAAELEGSFMLNDTLGASTRWVLTFPTRPAYVDNLPGGPLAPGAPPVAPFAGIDVSSGSASCATATSRTVARDGGISPGLERWMCKQVNVIRLYQYYVDEGFDPAGPYSTLVEEGRLRVSLHPERHVLTYTIGSVQDNATLLGLPVIARSFMEARNGASTYGIIGKVIRKQDGVIDF